MSDDDDLSDGPSFGWRPPEKPRRRERERPPAPAPEDWAGVLAAGDPDPAGAEATDVDPDDLLSAGRHGDGGETRAPRRLPVLIVLGVLLAAVLFVERNPTDTSEAAAVTPASATSVSAAAPGDGDAVWYCAAGTGRGSIDPIAAPVPAAPADVVAEHRLLITNGADAPRTVHLTAYPSSGDPVRKELTVATGTRLDLDLADVVKAPYVSATLEVVGDRVAVAHRLRGPAGESTAACSSSPAGAWFFAAGSTKTNTREVLVLFNPFPEQVVADVTFQAEEGDGRQAPLAPQKLEGVVVPPERPLAIDVTTFVADRAQLATRVEAREPTDRLVVDRLVFNPGGPTETPFLTVAPGSRPGSSFVFADGRPRRANLETKFVLYNPSTEPVDVELRLRTDRLVTAAVPFGATVHPGQYREIDLTGDSRIGADTGYWAVVEARTTGTFVVERVVVAKPSTPAAPLPGVTTLPAVVDAGGVTYTPGSPVLAREWIVPPAGAEGGAAWWR